MTEAADRIGRTLKVISVPFSGLLDAVESGQADAAMSAIFDTQERRSMVDFADYSSAGSQWLARQGTGVTPTTACGKRVGAVDGSVAMTIELPQRSRTCQSTGDSPISMVEVTGEADAARKIELNELDAYVGDSPMVRYAASQSKGRLVTAGPEYDVRPYGVAVARGSQLDDELAQAFASMHDDGTFARLTAKWGIDDPVRG